MKHILTFLLFVVHCSLFIETQATIRYVRPTSHGSGNGNSWVDASADLQLMINNSNAGDTIFVAAGTYLPIRPVDNLTKIDSNNRDNVFVLKADVIILGGFPNTGTATLTNRDWNAYPTILSGDIGVPNNSADNCYHVVFSIDNTAPILDGFTITDGNANSVFTIDIFGRKISRRFGGGMYVCNSSLVLTNVIISGNHVSGYGGGMVITENSSAVLTNVIISGNSVSNDGHSGGIIIAFSSPTLTNVVISGNKAFAFGGIFITSSSPLSIPILTNVTISGNHVESYGGGIVYQSYVGAFPLIIRNSIIWGNIADRGIGNNAVTQGGDEGNIIYQNSLVQQNSGNGSVWDSTLGIDGGNNLPINANPLFVNPQLAENAPTTAGNYRLTCLSPAIDMGNNAYYNADSIPDLSAITMDLDGNHRINRTVDLGAYEYYESIHDSILFTPLSFIYTGTGHTPKVTTLNGYIPEILYKEKNASDSMYSTTLPVNAGNHTVKASLRCITDTADFVILPKDITVKANGGSSIYGDNPVNPGFSATGLVNGETESVLTGINNNFSINEITPAGIYELQIIGTLTNTNYNITSYDTSTWIVNKRPLTIKAIDDTIYYGQTPVLAYEIISGSLANGDVLSGALYVDNYEVGIHTIEQGTLTASSNYIITFIEGTLLVWSIQDVFVDDKLAERYKSHFYFNSECGQEEASVYVTCYQCVRILINEVEQNPYTVSLPNYGDNNIIITVIAQNGDVQTHILTINRPIPFDPIVKMHCDNTITVNNNPASNGGFTFTSYKWFCNDKQFSENQSWSVNAKNEWWNPSDLFHIELTASGYSGILRTCKSTIALKDMELKFYPNPVLVWQTIYIKGDLDDDCLKDAAIEIYDMCGRLIENFPLTSLQILIGRRYSAGIYRFILKGKDGYRKEAGIFVQK